MPFDLPVRPIFALLLLAASRTAAGDPPPVQIYAAPPAIEGARLSPDGRSVAMIAPKEGTSGVVVWHPDGHEDWFTPSGLDQVNWVAWKDAGLLLMSLRATDRDERGRPVGVSRLVFSSLADHQSAKVHFDEPPLPANIIVIGRETYRPPNVQDRVVSLLPGDPYHILLAVDEADREHPSVMQVDVREGVPHLLMRPYGNVVKWLADASGVVRLKTSLDRHEDGSADLTYRVRDGESGEWRVLRRAELDSGPRFVPLAFSGRSPKLLLALADRPDGRMALVEIDTSGPAPAQMLASDPQCDIEPVMRDDQVIGYEDPCHGREETYFDAGWQKDQAMLQRALKTPLVAIIDRTPDGKFALIKSYDLPSAPARYWYFDQSTEPKTLIHIEDARGALPDALVAPVRTVSIAARDGLALPALLTLPPDRPAGPIGFVVLPHGGPTARDRVEFDWMAQFIASRGYGVLQPQFRGSSGYGAAFQRAGYREWGGKMQDDVTDATRWLIDQGLADAKRICIVGASYGGYAALVGAAQHPGLYQCVAAIAPVTDIARLLDDRDHGEFGEISRARLVGSGGPDAAPSPVDLAADITAPVLLIHGALDFTVPIAHSREMADALTRAGRSPKLVTLDDADHFFCRGDARLLTLKALGSFLSANLGVDPGRRS